ncbi:MAG TPA: NAD(P)/FAD-dependent oxidoreductase [Candidatus Limnocylindria bacterium]|nr:NAD(P)/FAD-dependent oxidoreductase [Candidatus Limnocylindria bacterium]
MEGRFFALDCDRVKGGQLTMPIGQRVVLIGGGHNALITAFYLARGGFKPLVLERREMVGGGAITEEFHPGFRASTLAHTLGPLRADVARDLQLDNFDCEILYPDPRVFAPTPDGKALLFYNDVARTAAEIARISAKDSAKYAQFALSLEKTARFFTQLTSITPPAIDKPTPEDLWSFLKTGRSVRRLGKSGIFDLLRWGPMAVADFVAEFFETELLRAVIAARGIFGAALGPWSAGSTAVLLLRAGADAHPVGPAVFPRGGLGSFTRALAESAKQAGAEIRTDAEVRHILVKDGAVTGIVLADGEEIAVEAVVSGVDPKRTFFHLVDPTQLDPTFANRMKNFRSNGTVAKVNLALGSLPTFTALDATEGFLKALSGRIHIGPEIDYLERAFDASKYGEFSRAPWLDVTIPTILDPSLAPDGKHVLSACVQFAPFKLKEGSWDSSRHDLGHTVVKTLAAYAPNLPNLIEYMQVITPLDFERSYGFTGGHIFHGELALDQLFTMRPVLDWARYKTPIRGLFLCGSGTHPGNGLTGASGANAAREIIRELR